MVLPGRYVRYMCCVVSKICVILPSRYVLCCLENMCGVA